MSAQVWRTARWFVALGLCALVVMVAVPMTIDALSGSLVFDDAEDDEGQPLDGGDADPAEPVGEVPTGPVEDGSAHATADFVLQEGVVDQAASPSLAISQAGDVVVTIFPLIEGDPECVSTAQLELHLQEGDPTELGVYAASIHVPLDDGAAVDDPRADQQLRAIAVTDGSPGRLLWDVSLAYRAWAAGELAPAGTSFALAIIPQEGTAALTFASVEGGAGQAPTLRWEGEPGCGDEVA